MAKKRVPLFQSPRGFVDVDTEATNGAQVGVNLLGPDGKVLSAEKILNPPAPARSGTGVVTFWKLIREVPENLVALSKLLGRGLAVRQQGGEWALRTLQPGAGIAIENGDGEGGNPSIALDEESIASLALADSAVQEIVPGAGLAVDSTNPRRPVLTVTAGGGFVPMRVPDGQTFAVPADQQALFTLPIELGTGASIELDGVLEEVS